MMLLHTFGALLLPLLPTVFQYWSLRHKNGAHLRRNTLLGLVLQAWICVVYAPNKPTENLILKGGSLFFAFRVLSLGVFTPLSTTKEIGIQEYYRVIFTLIPAAGKKSRHGGTFLRYLAIVLAQYLTANIIQLYFRYKPPQTELPVRTVLSLRQPELAVQHYLYGWLVYLYMSIYYFILVYPWCFVTDAHYTPIFDSPFISKSPKEFWNVRWNKVFHENFRSCVFAPINQAFVVEQFSPWRKTAVRILSGFFTFFISAVVHELLVVFGSNSPPTMENTLFFLLHGVAVSVQVLLEKFMGKDFLPNYVGIILSNLFFIWTAPLFVSPFMRNKLIDKCAPPMLF
ncbi:hypothetical protein K493DRAFT_370944 [Basidiobolus meristosporus CBS 931.73]|uniref:Wax synthase domain-containing protein n=1 Tax=Basidiobolus meristosporus CBS 931.73 TaxID=1314790 RepID=A0A1Y1YET8_9FUNG|nr:hypothetical protein K493DRAFT_370944 [Basidiobolus meristosporus CBS 931.73]|eukprot:ORX96478.1 hypothetical protein K493DRAFT_370944 [Basidiobolus meristosporus CBS 931.73]